MTGSIIKSAESQQQSQLQRSTQLLSQLQRSARTLTGMGGAVVKTRVSVRASQVSIDEFDTYGAAYAARTTGDQNIHRPTLSLPEVFGA